MKKFYLAVVIDEVTRTPTTLYISEGELKFKVFLFRKPYVLKKESVQEIIEVEKIPVTFFGHGIKVSHNVKDYYDPVYFQPLSWKYDQVIMALKDYGYDIQTLQK